MAETQQDLLRLLETFYCSDEVHRKTLTQGFNSIADSLVVSALNQRIQQEPKLSKKLLAFSEEVRSLGDTYKPGQTLEEFSFSIDEQIGDIAFTAFQRNDEYAGFIHTSEIGTTTSVYQPTVIRFVWFVTTQEPGQNPHYSLVSIPPNASE